MNVSNEAIIFAGLLANLIMQINFFYALVHVDNSNKSEIQESLPWQEYIGCLLTGEINSLKSFLTMLWATSIVSVGLAFAFARIIEILWGYSNYKIGMLVALPLWAINGLLAPLADSINSGVQKKLVQPLGLFGFGESLRSGIVFFIAHIAFGGVIGYWLS